MIDPQKVFLALLRLHLAQHVGPLVELVQAGSVERGREFFTNLRDENPAFAAVALSVFQGTPAEVVLSLAEIWPAVRELPNVEAFAGALQRVILVEWNRPRPWLPAKPRGRK